MNVTGDEQLGLAVIRDITAIRNLVVRLRAAHAPVQVATTAVESATAPAPSQDDRAPFGFPVMLEVRGRRVVVAGGGQEPAGKARTLADLGARVILWAEHHEQTAALAGTAGIEIRTGTYDPAILDGALIAIVGTGDRELDHRIAVDARERRVLVNTVDDIPYCDWSYPAILRRGDLTISIATAGIAPALAVRVRDGIGESIGTEYGDLLAIFATLRPRIMASGEPFGSRRRLWYDLVDGPALDLLRAGDPGGARAAVESVVADWEAR
jgi:precorrin-2 dehydrogenase/sirohydrochlorin ferrochelatase